MNNSGGKRQRQSLMVKKNMTVQLKKNKETEENKEIMHDGLFSIQMTE